MCNTIGRRLDGEEWVAVEEMVRILELVTGELVGTGCAGKKAGG